MKFKDLRFKPHDNYCRGVRASHKFANGYWVSVVKFPGSYGFDQGLYEVAIFDKWGEFLYDYDKLYENNKESIKLFEYFCLGKVIFSNGHVMGNLTEDEVEFILNVTENGI